MFRSHSLHLNFLKEKNTFWGVDQVLCVNVFSLHAAIKPNQKLWIKKKNVFKNVCQWESDLFTDQSLCVMKVPNFKKNVTFFPLLWDPEIVKRKKDL